MALNSLADPTGAVPDFGGTQGGMCGRKYSTIDDAEREMISVNNRWKRNPLGVPKNFNICPTHVVPIIAMKDGEPGWEMMRWGLVPSWAPDVKSADKYSLINARSEEIETKRSYSTAFKKRRCLVPVSGFFEWKREGETKRPFAIHLKEGPMFLAGVYERWTSKTGEIVDSYSILTTSSNSFMAEIHNRQPVVLPKETHAEWLDEKNANTESLKRLFEPCPPEWLTAHEVSKMVNSPKNNVPELLNPVVGT